MSLRSATSPLFAFALLLGASADANAQGARPVAARALKRARTAPTQAALPEGLASLPADTAAAIYAPRLDVFLKDLQETLDTLSLVEPSLAKRTLGDVLIESLSVDEISFDPARPARAVLSVLFTRDALDDVGVDTTGPLVIVPGVTEDVAVLRFALANRSVFERWLAKIDVNRRRVRMGGETATVLGPDTSRPVTCLSRRAHAFCQIGATASDDAIQSLRKVATFPASSLSRVRGIGRAFRRLPSDGNAYAVFNIRALALLAGRIVEKRRERSHRFDDPETRRRDKQAAKAKALGIRRAAAVVDGAAVGVFRSSGNITIGIELAFTPSGKNLLRSLSHQATNDELIRRWYETPALARAFMRLQPRHVSEMARSLDVALPRSALSGTVAFLMLGLDAECPTAKHPGQNAHGLDWAFVLPTAVSIGLQTPRHALPVHRHLAKQIEHQRRSDPAGRSRPPLRGVAYGSPIEIHVLDEMVLVGTGPGTGAAAMRRLKGLRKKTASRSPKKDAPFFQAAVHLRAIDAAFASGAFTRDHRPELLMFEMLRLKGKPLLESVDQVAVTARAFDAAQRMQIELRISR